MTAFLIVVALLMAWRGITWVRRRRRPSWEQMLGHPPLRRRPRRHRRIGDHRRHREATEAARTLAAMLAGGGHDPVAHLGAGVILRTGEMPWAQARARLATWDTHLAQVGRSQGRWWGRGVHSAARQVTLSGWQDHGEIDWLVTSLRLVGRTHPEGELLSIWWGGLAGIQVDLGADTVHLDGNNGWRGHITGPGVAPIAVATVAACHGPAALLVHPGLTSSRSKHPGPGVSGIGALGARTGWSSALDTVVSAEAMSDRSGFRVGGQRLPYHTGMPIPRDSRCRCAVLPYVVGARWSES